MPRTTKTSTASQRLQEFYRLGQRARKKTTPPAVANANTSAHRQNRTGLAAFAEQEGLSPGYVHNAIRFVKIYDRGAFKQLQAQIRDSGHQIGVGHVCQLIQVGDARQRRKLQQEMIGAGWSVRQLLRIREERFGTIKPDRQRGRKAKPPISTEDARGQLTEKVRQLTRMLETLLSVDGMVEAPAKLSGAVASKSQSTLESLGELLKVLLRDRRTRRAASAKAAAAQRT